MKTYIWNIIALLICPLLCAHEDASITFTCSPSHECDKHIACLQIDTPLTDPTPYIITLYSIYKNADALIIIMNSPGGSGGTSESIAREVAHISHDMPVITYVKDICASGAYLVASASHYIVAPQLSQVGSIGAYLGIEKENINSFQRKISDEDEHQESVISGNLSYEIIGSSDKKVATHPLSGELSDEERDDLEQEVYELSDCFADQISHNRNIAYNRHEWATGELFSGQKALELDLIDEIGSLTNAVHMAHTMLQGNEPHTKITNCILTPWVPGQQA